MEKILRAAAASKKLKILSKFDPLLQKYGGNVLPALKRDQQIIPQMPQTTTFACRGKPVHPHSIM